MHLQEYFTKRILVNNGCIDIQNIVTECIQQNKVFFNVIKILETFLTLYLLAVNF